MTTIAKRRIVRVFKKANERVRKGKRPNISGLMREEGYSEYSARSLKVTKTKTWQQLKAKYLDDEKALITLNELADKSNEDKDNRLKASKEILILNDRYPAKKNKIIGLYDRLSDITDKND